jgi:hypothetical protein
MSKNHGNVQFLAVARLSFGSAIIMCSHSYNAETDLSAVKQVLEQPNMSLNPGNHIFLIII